MRNLQFVPRKYRKTPNPAVARRGRRGRVVGLLAAFTALTIGLTLALVTRVGAVTGYHVVVGSAGLNARSGPGTGYLVVGNLYNGQPIDIACQTKGTLVGVGLPGTPTDVWDRLTNGWYITDYYTSTPGLAGGYTAGIPQCSAAPPSSIYNRRAAAIWAINNFDHANGSPLYNRGNDCAYFVSQTLWAAGIPKTVDWTNNSTDQTKLALWYWSPGATNAAANADIFKNYVISRGIATIKEVSWSDNTASGAQLGDIIGYDWNGVPDGVLDHLAIVTGLNQQGYPFVSQHSPPRLNRYWSWDPSNNGWIQSTHRGSRVYLIHIIR